MSACRKHKRNIALLAASALDASEAESVAEHLKCCAECEAYWQSMCKLTVRLNEPVLPAAVPTVSFHRRVTDEIVPRAASVLHPGWVLKVRRLWVEYPMTARAAAFAIIVAAFLLSQPRKPYEEISPGGGAAAKGITVNEEVLPTTLASYRRAADNSFETLDELLTEHGARSSGGGERLTVSAALRGSLQN